jgi:D-methionine transport system ATP-binding protein
MIQLENVNKIFNTPTGPLQVLKNINLYVPKGDIFGVVGKSGAGKSTLIRCVNVLERPTAGRVVVAGHDLTALTNAELRQARHKIGMIFQHFNLLSSLTVYENIALPLRLAKFDNNEINKIVTPLLELTELLDKKDIYPAALSGGQKQRVAIARALVYNPEVLLCDEATSALDPQTTKNILQLLKDINQKFGLTILLITHEIEVVKETCDHIALMDQGKIVEQNDILAFFTEPKSALAQEFIRTSLRQELPATWQAQLQPEKSRDTHPVLRIIFHGHAAAEPLTAYLMQELGIKLNILQANIEFIKHTTLGIMVTEVISAEDKLEQGIQYLLGKGVNVEIIGYVNRTIL